MFTIEAKKKGADEEFDFENILESAQVIHDDCYGGKANFREVYGPICIWWDVYCERCGMRTKIEKHMEEVRLKIAQTAIDGKERKLSDDIRVVQKS